MSSPTSKTYRLVSLGCRTNQYETEAFRTQLEGLGYRAAQESEEAEICIVNSCTVTHAAERDSRQAVRRLARENPSSQVVVTGCASEGKSQEFINLPRVSHVVPNAKKEELLRQVFPDEDIPEFKITHFEAHTRAFVKVQDGCNSFCTYCIIPYVRGRSVSRSVASIREEVIGLLENGYKEIVLTGINIGDFDGGSSESPVNLAQLMRELDRLPGLERLRLSSIDPDEVDEELIETILEGKNTCHSLHIVLQSGSNIILKRMNRKYTRQIFQETIDRLRLAAPDFTFTTDAIVGFPGETEEDLQETLGVIEETGFVHVHMFPFSPRQRTRAALMPNQVSPEVMRERKQRVLRASEQSGFRARQAFIGKTMRVLVEEQTPDERGCLFGHTDNFLPVSFPAAPDDRSNTFVEVRLVENDPKFLIGERLNER
ncbi:MAG: tRNA (N(6)-L-threonylcarbamoyladenosine(37)-C(2))-methylthiotransferase MtaB [Chlamydiia bacterium]|nr:tRNA (N(6)-L-threonylcarbamoyladenosine(37)-C(2))-methylthiotransferase MtaB [Chlamydiia bacterium]